MLSSYEEALELLDRVRAAFGLGPAAQGAGAAFRAQLMEAHPLLSLMLTRLQANDTPEERADLRHNWHKALRRRGWTTLPPLDGTGQVSPGSTVQPPSRPATAVSDGPQGDGDPAPSVDLAEQVAGFLSLFGVRVEPTGLPLTVWPQLPDVVAQQRALADQLRQGPLRSPESYRQAYRAAVDPWNEMVGHSALRIPD